MVSSTLGGNIQVSEETLEQAVAQVWDTGEREGTISGLHLRFLAEEDAVLAQDLLRLVTDGELRSSIARNAAEKFARINDAEGYRRIMERCYRQGGTL